MPGRTDTGGWGGLLLIPLYIAGHGLLSRTPWTPAQAFGRSQGADPGCGAR